MNNSTPKAEKIFTVTEITRLIKNELEKAFPSLWVEGELSNLHRHHSGHVYFTMKDKTCQLKGVMFRAEAQRVRFSLEDGLQVVCRGRINVYEPRGEYQLVAEVMEPKGKGALQLAFEQLKEKLRKEGLFDPKHKKKLPLFPRRIGVVTSPRGAAIIDILRTLERRFAPLHILIYPVRVQGEGAADEIVEGIEHMGHFPSIDAVIVGRGGGSMEDLWAFNEEKVARAIFRCPVPVISAVGHEIDFTIADFVADVRASTPSAAAEMVIDKEQSFVERIESLEKRADQHIKYFLQEQKHTVLGLVQHRAFQNFSIRLLNLSQKVDDLDIRASSAMAARQKKIAEYFSRMCLLEERMGSLLKALLQRSLAKWDKLSSELHALSPLNVLKKGYTLCWKNEGKELIRRIEEVGRGEELTVSFYKGEYSCLVKNVDKDRRIESRILKG